MYLPDSDGFDVTLRGHVETLRVLLETGQLRAGLATGCLALVAVVVVGLVRGPGKRVGQVGVAFAAAGAAVLSGLFGAEGVDGPSAALLWGLALLAVGGAVSTTLSRRSGPGETSLWVTVALATALLLPGALLVGADGDLEGPGWVGPLLVVVTAVGGALLGRLDADPLRRGLGPAMLLVSVVAVFATVPDTEEMRALVGVALPLAVLGGAGRGAGLGAGGPAAVGLLVHTAAVGGVGRPSSIIGAVGTLGMLVAIPIVGVRRVGRAAGAPARCRRRRGCAGSPGSGRGVRRACRGRALRRTRRRARPRPGRGSDAPRARRGRRGRGGGGDRTDACRDPQERSACEAPTAAACSCTSATASEMTSTEARGRAG